MPKTRAGTAWPLRRIAASVAAMATIAGTVVMAVAAPASAAGNQYYVNCSASSNGSGTQASPWNSTASVNAVTFQPGDQILLDRGTTCSGNLAPKGSGNSGASITIDAYGSGALPVIATGSSANAAVELNDQSYWNIQNLTITGGVGFGVYITGSTANAVMTNINLTNLDVSAATGTSTVRGDSGEVYVYPTGSQEVVDNLTVNGVTAHDSKVAEGIFIGGAYGANPPGTSVPSPGSTPIGQNITVENSTAYNVYGDGILMTMVQNGTIQNSVAYNSGNCGNCGYNSTPDGLWEWYCQNCTLQYNESYSNHSWGNSDGGAFDIDNYNSNNTLQYNYGHNNSGYCLAVFGVGYTPVNDVFRYNVCADNEQNPNSSSDEVGFVIGSTTNLQLYNNTFYFNPANTQPFIRVPSGSSGTGLFKNNIVYSTSTNLVDNSGVMPFDNNIYYVTTGSSPTFKYNGTTYTGLSAYQSASGQETHSLNTNPLLNNPTYTGTGISSTADTLQSGSPAFGAGTNICQGISGCSMGTRDFFGNSVSTTGAHNIGAYDTPATGSLLSNPGFESGSCSSWYCWNGAAPATGNAHTGSYALTIPSNGGGQQTVTGLSPNTTYSLQGFAKTTTAGQCVYLGVKSYGGNETNTCISTTNYSAGAVTFTTGSSNTSAIIYFWNPSSNTATGYGDDVSLIPLPSASGPIVDTASNSCLDITGNVRSAGTAAEIWTCNQGANQQFTTAANGELQVYSSPTMCLDTSGGSISAGTAVVIASCTGGSSQLWTVRNGGTITENASGLCLGPAGGGTSDGTDLQIQTCSGASSQKWTGQ